MASSFIHFGRKLHTLPTPAVVLGYGRLISPRSFNCPQIGLRYLFTEEAMGIDGFIYSREKTAIMFKNLQDKFRERMLQVIASESKNLIFTEDLKNAVHLAEATEEDISLVLAMTKKFNTQHQGLRFGEYIFGPVVMRLFYILNQPDAALQALHTEELEGFFDQFISYQLALDLMYNNERYTDVLDIFKKLQEKRLSGVKYPKNCLTIALASCYKMNSEESFRAMVKLYEDMKEHGTSLNFRSIIFCAALAYRQNYPHIALEILSQTTTTRSLAVNNLKVLSLIDLGRVEDCLPVLRSVIQVDLPDTHFPAGGSGFLKDTIKKVEAAVMETGNKELISEFQYVFKGLQSYKLIGERTLDDVVSEPIEKLKERTGKQQDRAMLAASFNRNTRSPRQTQGQNRFRKGLMEME